MADRNTASVDREEGWEEYKRCQVIMGGEEDAVVPGGQVLVAGFVYLGGDGFQGFRGGSGSLPNLNSPDGQSLSNRVRFDDVGSVVRWVVDVAQAAV